MFVSLFIKSSLFKFSNIYCIMKVETIEYDYDNGFMQFKKF